MTGHRLLVRAGAGWLLLFLVAFLLPPAANAETKNLPEGDFTARYGGTLQETIGGSTTPYRQQLVLTCKAGSCRVSGVGFIYALKKVEIPQAPSLRVAHTARLRVASCRGLVQQTIAALEVDGATATYTVRIPTASNKTCNGNGATLMGVDARFTGKLVSLQVQQKPAAVSPSASPTAGAAGSSKRPTGSTTPKRGDTATTSRLESGAADAPSVLSSLPTVADSSMAPRQLLALVAAVVVLVLLVAFPTHLLDSATESGRERWSAWRRRRRGESMGESEEAPVLSPRRWAAAAGVALAAALIAAFIDPGFGLNAGSIRVLGSLFVALAVESLLVWFAVIWVTRRADPDAIAGFHAAPGTLVVVAIAVLVTRMTGFEPGIVFGLVAGVTFAVSSSAAVQGRVALAELGLAFGLALLGWFAYSAVGPAVAGDGFGRTLVSETLAGIAVAGMASLPLALVPLRGLAGHTLWTWSKPLWATAYAVSLVGFFVVLMPMPFSWEAVNTPLRTWVLLYLAYAVTAVLAWTVMTQPWRRETTPSV